MDELTEEERREFWKAVVLACCRAGEAAKPAVEHADAALEGLVQRNHEGWFGNDEPKHLQTCGTSYRGCDPACTYQERHRGSSEL